MPIPVTFTDEEWVRLTRLWERRRAIRSEMDALRRNELQLEDEI